MKLEKIKVLIVDDSSVVRAMISKVISTDASIIVSDVACNGKEAIEKVMTNKYDIVILDIAMPEMDGMTALPHIIKHGNGAKVIMFSYMTSDGSEMTLKALKMGAADYMEKPSAGEGGYKIADFNRDLITRIKAIANSNTANRENNKILLPEQLKNQQIPIKSTTTISLRENITNISKKPLALAIGSSTGGPQALLTLFEKLRGKLINIPIFITQHMPANFTLILANSLSQSIGRPVHEASDKQEIKAGGVYLAPGDYHMIAQHENGKNIIHLNQEDPENFCRPAVDPMLRSLSKIYGKDLMILILTGMGQDGLEGSKLAVDKGARLIAQDQDSSIVWGMPGAVAKEGICNKILPLPEIADYIEKIFS